MIFLKYLVYNEKNCRIGYDAAISWWFLLVKMANECGTAVDKLIDQAFMHYNYPSQL